MKGLLSAVSLATVLASASARTWTVKNNCAFTIWPGMFTDPSSPSKPSQATGWEAPAGSQVTFDVPNDWKSGRIWASTFTSLLHSPTGLSGCNGGLECAAEGGTGVPPASVAEWTLQGDQNLDYYDVSLVDGSNLPMSITNNVGCNVADCPADLNANCPTELAQSGSNGVVGCKSACFANLDGNQQDSANCCSGSHSTPDTCPPSGVQFYDYFKKACPNSYVYAYDESSKTALWTCDSGKNADYTLTFCP
ncbi:hypothetical protein D9758_007654 [Tetrapyrgos nigripes]|uniref:Thaumatin-like protein n=1 Tax=Tetrapyrgos nigripes TaxID=182062 RepID=A0A8H5G5I3_9AGAR|nr:hypothetical protein D9758_007654 [Tetrapyrgos nigripes]